MIAFSGVLIREYKDTRILPLRHPIVRDNLEKGKKRKKILKVPNLLLLGIHSLLVEVFPLSAENT